ncbi:phage capsid protein [Microbacterium sp. BG28]|uniref:major capsid protein n=1 Tax=Microbacterium sp. BG28 TaxID=3097356 RepID=UPI002A599C9E|nr:phage capsid protein [Microbacterium sp. BG28]MDY0828582.1 phage capsid protein [Microbacterium sp. BG28]
MPVSLIEASRNAVTDYDPFVIDEFRKESVIADTMIFDDVVNPAGGGGVLTYGYRRQVTQPTAAFRPLNTEYVPSEVQTITVSSNLAVLGGTFAVDRVVAKIGPAASGSVALNMRQKAKAAVTKFQDAVINGDVATDAAGFDGLDKALVGSTTEFRAGQVTDWRDWDTDAALVHKALDDIDEFLSLLDGAPTIILGNAKALARVRAAARRAGQYVKDPVDGLVGQDGRPITRESYGGITFANPGAKPGTNDPIIPISTRTVGGASTTGLTDLYAYRVGLDGFHGLTTMGGTLVETWLPDFTNVKAVQEGGVELGPVGVALKATKAAAVFRNLRVQ